MATPVKSAYLSPPYPIDTCQVCEKKFDKTDTDTAFDLHNHRFHRECIVRWIKSKKTCPINGESLKESDLFAERAAPRQVLPPLVRNPQLVRPLFPGSSLLNDDYLIKIHPNTIHDLFSNPSRASHSSLLQFLPPLVAVQPPPAPRTAQAPKRDETRVDLTPPPDLKRLRPTHGDDSSSSGDDYLDLYKDVALFKEIAKRQMPPLHAAPKPAAPVLKPTAPVLMSDDKKAIPLPSAPQAIPAAVEDSSEDSSSDEGLPFPYNTFSLEKPWS